MKFKVYDKVDKEYPRYKFLVDSNGDLWIQGTDDITLRANDRYEIIWIDDSYKPQPTSIF